MKQLKHIIQEKLKIGKTSFMLEKLKVSSKTKINTYRYHPKNLNELKNIIKDLVKERGCNADLNDIDVSKITSMFFLFTNDLKTFNGNISEWDVSNVFTFEAMFYTSEFTGENSDLSNWNVSGADCLACMFERSKFNQREQIEHWKVNSEAELQAMFRNSPLEKNPPKWYHE